MKIALCQIEPTIGDFENNCSLIVSKTESALAQGADLAVFPEMALCGYPPMDLLDQPGFSEQNERALRKLQHSLPRSIAVAVGHIGKNISGSGRALTNCISVIKDGAIVFSQAKTLLPTYDVFDEARYFEPAKERQVFKYLDTRIGFAICEDVWYESVPVPGLHYTVDPAKELLDRGAELIIVPSASPYQLDKLETRINLCTKIARNGNIPVAYCNTSGANDSLIFDGHSFVVNAEGRLCHIASAEPYNLIFNTAELNNRKTAELPHQFESLENALVTGIKSYMKKCGFVKAHLGLSGGIDSALVALLATKAVDNKNITCIALPSRFSSEGSITDSEELCNNLGIPLKKIPIEKPYTAFLEALYPNFEDTTFGLTEENLQARIRGVMLMAWSNKYNSMLLTTGNKSELAVGYCTLYGDMSGALAPIGDLYKTKVYEFCEYLYNRDRLLPRAIIDKVPSAELRPNQTDQDSLPPYPELDAILELYIEKGETLHSIIQKGFNPDTVARVIKLTGYAEYKRRQAAPVLKVTSRAFGLGRRYPIARKLHELL
ncbi:MAG TPA: NAD+ synthase [Spirochaetales bacterium]|nr:NAD+ synthase [Spirochaetales bacterium]HQK33292.1 NAD+ synthase [Spirochaetales bacterium]